MRLNRMLKSLVSAGDRTVLRLESRKSVDLDLSDVTRDGRIEIFPHVEERGLLFLQFRRSKVVVAAGPYVGLIPLTPQILIEVRPKLPVANLSRILDVAQQSLSLLSGTERLYVPQAVDSSSIIEFLALNLQDAVHPLIQSGYLKKYRRRIELGSQPRGRIDVAGTMRAWGRGQHHLLNYNQFEQTADSSENRVIKAGLRIAAQRVPADTKIRKVLISALNVSYNQLPATISGVRGRDIDEVKRTVRDRALSDQRAYYYRALEVAVRIISNEGVSLEQHGGEIGLASFIVNFEELFEDYLRRVLQRNMAEGIAVRDGNKEGRRYLFDGGRGQLAQPDIVVLAGPDRKALVVEVKYKDKPSRDDINQAITYAAVYRTKNVVLVHQCASKSRAGLYKIGTIDGIRLSGFGYDLGSENLVAEETRFVTSIFGLACAMAPVEAEAA